jgi:colanic acid biosynthesis glycosyl transferase WcaI
MNLLVVTPYYAPDFGPSAPIYTSLCEDLVKLGCNVTVVTSMPHFGGAERIYNTVPRQEVLRGVLVIRENTVSDSKKSLLKRLVYHLFLNITFAYSVVRRAKQDSSDVILADAPFFWAGLPLLVAILMRKPYIYIVHDIFPDVLVRLGLITSKLILRALNIIELFFYSRADFVSVLSDGFKQNLMGKKVPASKIVVIPTCVDTDFVKPLPPEGLLRRQWGLDGKFVILYSGNLGLSQDVDILLSAASLSADLSDVRFVVVGEGVRKEYLRSRVEEMGLKNVQFHSFLPRERVPELYSLADVSLVLLNKQIEIESVPSKTFTIMASGRPLIAVVGENSEIEGLINNSGCGIRVPPGDGRVLFTSILRLYQDEKLRFDMGDRARGYAVEHYSKDIASRKYFELINFCAKRGEYVAAV